jgi:predicted phage tail protein
MERPKYNDAITRQNDIYAMEIIERHHDRPKTAESFMQAITTAFLMGAGGYKGDFDAAMTLENGGMAVLLDSLGISDIDTNMSQSIDPQIFEDAVRAAIDFGAAWDDIDAEIGDGAVGDTQILGSDPFDGPISGKFTIRSDKQDRPHWLDDD